MGAPDHEVIASSATDPAAFATIFDRHAETIHRLIARRLGRQLADDLASDTFRIAFERRATFDASYTSAAPWLVGIALNLVRRHHRQEGRRLRATARAAARQAHGLDPLIDVDVRIDAADDASAALAGLAALRHEDREVLLLIAWEDMSPTEIGLALGIPAGTVRSRLHRARGALREAMDQHVDAVTSSATCTERNT